MANGAWSPNWLETRITRLEAISQTVLQTSFGGLIGGVAVVAAAPVDSAVRTLVLIAAIASGAAAGLALDALRFEAMPWNTGAELYRKWRRTHDALHLLIVAALAAVLAAAILLG